MAHNKRKQLRELHLFAGAGGGILGGMLCGHRTVCAVEIEKYPREILLQRQRDGILPEFPIWDDVRTFDGKPWRGKVDVVCGGFPCQDISCAGKGAGIDGERSGMWGEMARIIGEIRPQCAFVENSPMLVGRGLARVIGDLAEMGYDARWGVMGAHHAGAPHKRDRIWILANTHMHGNITEVGRCLGEKITEKSSDRQIHAATWDTTRTSHDEREGSMLGLEQITLQSGNVYNAMHERNQRREQQSESGESEGNVANANSAQRQRDERAERIGEKHANPSRTSWWTSEPNVGRVANGVASRVDRLKAIGNGQVCSVAALAWNTLMAETLVK